MATRAPRQYRDVFYDVLSGSTAAISVGAVATLTTNVANTVSVPGAVVGDVVTDVVTLATLGAINAYGYVTAADVVTLCFSNTTAGSITPTASSVYTVLVGKVNPALLI